MRASSSSKYALLSYAGDALLTALVVDIDDFDEAIEDITEDMDVTIAPELLLALVNEYLLVEVEEGCTCEACVFLN